jgi:hypothetical protein
MASREQGSLELKEAKEHTETDEAENKLSFKEPL